MKRTTPQISSQIIKYKYSIMNDKQVWNDNLNSVKTI